MKRRGQVTLFIIIGIILVAGILVSLLWVRPTFTQERTSRLGFEGCVEDALTRVIKELGPKAGYARQEFTYQYFGEDISYLCYTNEYHVACTVQEPFLKQHFEENIEEEIQDEVRVCYENSVEELLARGHDVQGGAVEFEVSLEPNIARVTLTAPTRVDSSSVKKFVVRTTSPTYEMLMIATSIMQYETKLGDADVSSLMSLYPDLIIDKQKQSDGTTIYTIESKLHGNQFKFASRSLAWPPGYDI